MTIMIKKNLVSPAKYNIKCPNYMEAEFITFHNTYNDATAQAEVNYMIGNNSSTSFHYAVDDKEVVQGIPENRNAWACGDGSRGNGNRKSISVEVCYSKSGGTRYREAEALAIKFIAQLLHERNWGVDRVKEHHHWSGKNCPHCVRDEGRWGEVVALIQKELAALKGGKVESIKPAPVTVKGYLEKGDKGAAVTNLQTLLEKAGYELGKIDGVYGNATYQAVRRAQQDNKLKVDGLAGQATMQVLEALNKPKPAVKPVTKPATSGSTKQSVTPKPTSPAPVKSKDKKATLPNGVYKQGSKGDAVKQIQEALTKLNFKLGKCDGDWGKMTTSAMKRFQSVYCNPADGVYGEKTRKAMLEQLNK